MHKSTVRHVRASQAHTNADNANSIAHSQAHTDADNGNSVAHTDADNANSITTTGMRSARQQMQGRRRLGIFERYEEQPTVVQEGNESHQWRRFVAGFVRGYAAPLLLWKVHVQREEMLLASVPVRQSALRRLRRNASHGHGATDNDSSCTDNANSGLAEPFGQRCK